MMRFWFCSAETRILVTATQNTIDIKTSQSTNCGCKSLWRDRQTIRMIRLARHAGTRKKWKTGSKRL